MQARPDEQLTTLALRVRCVGRWLVAIEAVQALAWVLVPVSGVVVVCWALGCCTRLAPAVRVAVALLWLAGGLLGIVWLIRRTRRPMSYPAAADFVEGRCSLDRRLVTAMEYYEAGRAYPYSLGLADQVVADAARATEHMRLDTLVDKWRLWSLCGLAGLALGLGAAFTWLMVRPLFAGSRPAPHAPVSRATASPNEPNSPPVSEEPNLVPPAIERIWAQVTAPDPNGAGAEARAFQQEVVDGNLAVPLGSRVDLTLQADRGLAQAEVAFPDGTTRTLGLEGSNRVTLGLQADRAGRVQIKVTDPNGLTAQTTVAIQTREPVRPTPQFRLLSPDGDCFVAEDANVTIAFEVLDEGGLGFVRLVYQQPDKAATVLEMPAEPGAKSVTFSHTLDIQALGLRAGDCILFHASADQAPTWPQGQSKTFHSPVYMIEVRPKTDPQPPEPAGPPGVKVDTLLDVLEYTRALIKNTWAAMQAQGPDARAPDLKGLVHDVGYCRKALSRIRDDPNAGLSDEQKAAIAPILSDYDQASQALDRADPAGALPAEERAYQALRLMVQEGPPQEPGQSVPDPNAGDRPERVRIEDPNQPELPGRQSSQQQGQDTGTLGDQLAALAQQQGRLKDQLSRLMHPQKNGAREDQETADQASSESSQSGSSSKSGQSGQSAAKGSSGQGGQGGPSAGAAQSPTGDMGQDQKPSDQGADKGREGTANQEQTSEGSAQSGQQGSSGQEGQSDQSAGDAQSSGPGNGQDQGPSDQRTGSGQEGTANQGQTPKGGGQSGQRGSQGEGAGGGQGRSSAGSQARTSTASDSDRLAMLKAKQLALQQQAKALSASMPGAEPGSESSSSGEGQPGPSSHAVPGVDSSVREAAALMDQALNALGQMQAQGAVREAEGQRAAQSMDQAQRELAKAGAAAQGASERQAQAERLAKDLLARAQALERASLSQQGQGLAGQLSDAEALLKALGRPSTATVGGGSHAGAPNLSTVLTRSPNVAPTELARRMAEELRTASLGPGRRPGRVTPQEPTDLGFFESENAFYEAAARPRTGEP